MTGLRFISLAAAMVIGCSTSPTPKSKTPKCPIVTLTGTVSTTKGAMLMLRGTFLDVTPRSERARAWKGKHVVLRGERCVRTCGPREQCLVSDQMASLKNIEVIKIGK